MLGKLAVRNAKRSIKDYLIYLITITISFSLIFAFNLVASSDEVIELSRGMDTFKDILFFINVVIIFVICFLINYTTKFMFEKRSKELGTYMLLGIKKKEIARLLIMENMLLGAFALILSIPLGFLFSQFVSLVIVNLLGIPEVIFISVNIFSIGLLVLYFLAIYVLVLFNLLRRIRKMTVHDFLYFDKQNEKKMFRNSKKRTIIFLVSAVLGVTALLLWSSRWTMENSGKQETLTYLMVSMILLIISIYGVSATCADMLLSVILKHKKMKYQKDNLFVTRTFTSKARTMSFTFGTLSMLILLSLLCLNFASINKGVYKESIELTAPFDVHVFDGEQPFDDFQEYIDVVDEGYSIKETMEYNVYKEPKHQIQNYYDVRFYDYDLVIKLSDYNKIRELRNLDTIGLKDDEYVLVTSKDLLYKVEDNKEIKKIQFTSGKEFHLKDIDTKTYWYQIDNTGRFAVVVPDEAVQGFENGYEVCRKIKKGMQVPIIFVTSRDTNADELKSIQAGGIDFITKPYDTLILLEKIKRALQLSNPNNFRQLEKKDCTIDLHLSILKYQDKSIELTRNEFRILYYFFMNEDKTISKEELLETLWNDKYYLDENVLMVNMTRLKKKMKEIGIVHLLENIRGKGWKL